MTDAPVVLRASGLVRHIPVTQGVVFRRTVGRIQVVDGVDLEVRRGETLGLVGESGCGKSTLAGLLTALDKPTAGEITLLGERLDTKRGKRLAAARRHIQLIFQDPFTSLDPRMTVESIIREPFTIHPDVLPRSEQRHRVRELLEIVGLNPDHADRYPHQFSGGQRQRIGIARALALRPEVLVCDESVSALDVSVQGQILNLLTELQREFGIACLFISHDLAVVEHIADRIAVMYLGRIIEHGPSDEVYDHPRHPYTQALLSAIPEANPNQARRRTRIRLEGEVPNPLHPPSGCAFRTRCWKAAEVCARETPRLRLPSTGPSHEVACHFA
jgi:oligopeptide transport system ATP-binding protein